MRAEAGDRPGHQLARLCPKECIALCRGTMQGPKDLCRNVDPECAETSRQACTDFIDHTRHVSNILVPGTKLGPLWARRIPARQPRPFTFVR